MYSIIGGIAFLNIPKCGSSTLRSLEVHRAADIALKYAKDLELYNVIIVV